MPTQEKQANLSVIPLEVASQIDHKIGRPRKTLKLPPLPQEILDGMTPLEQEHFKFFIASFERDYPGMTPSDLLCLNQAAIEYINLLRVQATQMQTKQVISMARQHPGVQLRQWLDAMSVTRKQRQATEPKKDKATDEMRAFLEGLAG